MRTKRLSIAASMIALLALILAGSPIAGAQKQCKVDRVGTTPEDFDSKIEPELWALIIGVSTFKYGGERVGRYAIRNLQYASDDADAIYDFLRSDRGGAFREDRIKLLKDEDATKANVEAALAWLKQARPHDYFVVFIATHGTIDWEPDPETGAKLPYFVLYDTDPRDLKGTGFKMTLLRQTVERDFPRKGLVMADTCHSAGVTLPDGTNLSVPANDDFIKQMELLPKAVGYISAAYQTQSSYEKDELYHGVFTYCLLEALRGEADRDHNEIVSFDEVVNYLFNEVPEHTAGQQHIYPATNSLDANCLPLAIARYGCPGGDCGTIVIRNPDLDGIEYKVGAGASERLARNVETTLRLRPGQNEISFFRRGAKNKSLPIQVQSGETAEINVKLAFSNYDEASGSNLENRQYDLYLVEEGDTPEAVKSSFESGVESFDKQRFDEAISKLKRAGDDYHPALVYRGRAEQALGQFEKAIASFTRATLLKPSDYETETLLAETRFDLAKTRPGGKSEALKIAADLKKIVRRYPREDFPRVVLGDVLFWLGNRNGAERELRHAIAIKPKSPPAHMILADILSNQPIKGKREEAIKEAETALQLFRELSTKKVTFKRLSLSHLIFGGGRYVNQAALAEASYILGKAIVGFVEAYPDHPNRERNLSRAGAALEEAEKLANGIKARLRLALVKALRSQMSMLSGDAAGAVATGRQALDLSDSTANPTLEGYIHNTLSQAYENNQDYCKAAEHQRDIIRVLGERLHGEKLRQAEERLAKLTSMAVAHRQKCKL